MDDAMDVDGGWDEDPPEDDRSSGNDAGDAMEVDAEVVREALRTLVKSRLLELHQPGSGVAFAALRTRPNLWRTIRRLLPYVAVLLAELPRAGRSTSAERIAAAVGYFVVATDSQLRDWCGMQTDPEAVWAEAHRARLHEMCARVQGVSGD